MPWEPKYTDKELAETIVKVQEEQPLQTLAAACVELKVGRNYITTRAKESELVSCAKKRADQIREKAWMEQGIEGSKMGKDFNATVYIWMTRNILKWNDRPPALPFKVEDGKDGPTLTIDLGQATKKK